MGPPDLEHGEEARVLPEGGLAARHVRVLARGLDRRSVRAPRDVRQRHGPREASEARRRGRGALRQLARAGTRARDGLRAFAVKGVVLVILALVVAGCGASSRRHFSAKVTNEWFPLRPGAVWVYRGVKDSEPSRDVVRVTSMVRVIDGAPTVAVSDRLYLSGKLEERTTDY